MMQKHKSFMWFQKKKEVFVVGFSKALFSDLHHCCYLWNSRVFFGRIYLFMILVQIKSSNKEVWKL